MRADVITKVGVVINITARRRCGRSSVFYRYQHGRTNPTGPKHTGSEDQEHRTDSTSASQTGNQTKPQ